MQKRNCGWYVSPDQCLDCIDIHPLNRKLVGVPRAGRAKLLQRQRTNRWKVRVAERSDVLGALNCVLFWRLELVPVVASVRWLLVPALLDSGRLALGTPAQRLRRGP